jgi:hypothetical protein
MCEIIFFTVLIVIIVTVVICGHIDGVAREVRRLSDIIDKDMSK